MKKQSFLGLNLLFYIMSAFVWPTAYINDWIVTVFGVLLYIVFAIIYKVKVKINQKSCLIIFSFLIFSTYCVFLESYKVPLKYLPPLLLCFFHRNIKYDLLKYVTKWYGVLMILSVGIYLILFFVDLPSFGTLSHYIYAPYENYLVYLKPTDILDQFRFEAFYFEPGHCAMVGSMLLFANRYDFKKNLWLLPTLLSVLLSLSLAGYVLLIIGIFLQYVKNTKIMISFIILCLISFIIVAYIWDNGNNPVNELIVGRLEFSETGGIKGNNRTYMDTDRYISESLENGSIWFGLGIKKFNDLFNHSIAGSGYKIYLLQYGLIGMLLLLSMLYSYTLTATINNTHFARIFWCFIVLSFLQRCYTFWFSWQLPFICSIVIPPQNANSIKNKLQTITPSDKSNSKPIK